MHQRDLNRCVARRTGETIAEISRRGFSPLMVVPAEPGPEDLIVDWDAADLLRNVALVEQRPHTLSAL